MLNQKLSYKALQQHYQIIATQRMADWFAADKDRFNRYTLQVGEILLDYSKNRLTDETLALLFDLANENSLAEKIAALFSGEIVNTTEKRPALHTALRKKNADHNIQQTLEKMRGFVDKVHQKKWIGATGKPITDIVNIGIGGSHLGPMLATHALAPFTKNNLRCHFISNIDQLHIDDVLNQINPESTLFIISSKTFTTIETMTNAKIVRTWLQNKLQTTTEKHFLAVTANPENALKFGIPAEQIFSFWDWVGGRYSIWSAIGLPLALLVGMDHFLQFLAGAHAMDEHFRSAPFEKNMPVILGLIGVWYINFFNAATHAIIPYSHQLNYLPDYIQQLDMESNGKSIHHNGNDIPYATGPVIIGKQGCDGQHSFFQALHQSAQLIPVDFILTCEHQQDLLVASALAQSQALMQGKAKELALAELKNAGFSAEEAHYLAAHKTIPGNHPSNLIFLDNINPYNLGALLALYEHKVYVQGVIWGINSFDQWGVELGKQLLPKILADLQHDSVNLHHDASTHGLIQHYKSKAKA